MNIFYTSLAAALLSLSQQTLAVEGIRLDGITIGEDGVKVGDVEVSDTGVHVGDDVEIDDDDDVVRVGPDVEVSRGSVRVGTTTSGSNIIENRSVNVNRSTVARGSGERASQGSIIIK